MAGIALDRVQCRQSAAGESEGDYVSQIQAARAAKDDAFRKQPDEPVPASKVKEFLPLKYFPAGPGIRRARIAESCEGAHRRRDAHVDRAKRASISVSACSSSRSKGSR